MFNRRIVVSIVALAALSGGSFWYFSKPQQTVSRNLSDEALLALIKNDQKAFDSVLEAGVNIHEKLPLIDGKIYTIAQGTAHFERVGFMKSLSMKKISYLKQSASDDFDIMTLAVHKNNPEILSQLALEKPDFKLSYGKKGWSLLHLASSICAHKLTPVLHTEGKLDWSLKAKDGSTPLTLAAQSDCLPMLSYWKEQGADFNQKDGRGLTALSILRTKKDAALLAFAESFMPRRSASVVVAEVNFYKKRKIPKEQRIDHAAMIEPDDRPLEATETAESSEFSD